MNILASTRKWSGGQYRKICQHYSCFEENSQIMKVFYNQTADTLTIIFTETPVAESDEDKPGVILDYDDKGNLVSLEIMDALRRVNVPGKIEYQVSPVAG